MASTSIDLGAVFWGSVLPGSVAERVAKAYRKHLFDDTTLQDLPDEPRFVFNATNLESGVLFRFSKPYMGDYRVGRILNRRRLAVAVAASSAFPPVLSPCVLDLSDETWKDDEGNDLGDKPGFRDEIKLSDGGVYDNMGLETAWKRYKTILVSDAGGHVDDDPTPPRTGCARRRGCSSSSTTRSARCASARSSNPSAWTRRECMSESAVRSPTSRSRCSAPTPRRPSSWRTWQPGCTRCSREEQERLINWGYIVCDAGLRSHVANEAELERCHPVAVSERAAEMT